MSAIDKILNLRYTPVASSLLDEARAELAALRADSERLDGYFALIELTGQAQPIWFNEAKGLYNGIGWYYGKAAFVDLNTWTGALWKGPYETFRAAIDDAMKEASDVTTE